MKHKSITKNYLYNLSYQLLTLITPLITTPYVSRVLGADGIGIYSYTTSVVAYFVLLGTIGLSDYGQREIAYHQNDRKAQSRILYEVSIFRVFAVIISLFLYYIIILRNVETNYLIFVIQSLNIIALIFDTAWFFQGLEEFGKVVFRNFVLRIISIVMLFVLIKQANDLWAYVLLNSAIALLGGVWVCFYLPNYLVKVPIREINPFRNFYIIIQLFLPQIAIQVYTVLDKTMIGVFTNIPAENGYYEQAEKCVKMVLMVVTSLGTVMLPRIASAFANEEYKLVYDYIMKAFRFVWFLSLPLVALIIAVSPNFVPWFFGPGFDKVIILLQMFSILIIAIGLSQVIGIQYLVATNQQNLMTLSVVCGSVVNFFMNLFLIPRFMSVGATVASIVAEIVVTLVQFYIVRKTFHLLIVFKLARNYFIGAIISFVCLYGMSQYLTASFISTFIMLILGVVLYVLVLNVFEDEMLLDVIHKIKLKFAK